MPPDDLMLDGAEFDDSDSRIPPIYHWKIVDTA